MNEGEIRVLTDQTKNLAWELLKSLNNRDFTGMKHWLACLKWNIEKIEEFINNEIT